MHVCVYMVYVRGVYTSVCRSQKRKLGTLFYCTPLYSVKGRSLIEPGALLASSKPAMDRSYKLTLILIFFVILLLKFS